MTSATQRFRLFRFQSPTVDHFVCGLPRIEQPVDLLGTANKEASRGRAVRVEQAATPDPNKCARMQRNRPRRSPSLPRWPARPCGRSGPRDESDCHGKGSHCRRGRLSDWDHSGRRTRSFFAMTAHRFPPPWTVEDVSGPPQAAYALRS